MKLYKLTDSKSQTYNKTQWGEGVSHTAAGKGDLCGPGWIHAYTSPLLAVLLNPIHGNFEAETMQLWECEAKISKNDNGLKVGCASLKTIKRIKVPEFTQNQKTYFAILCAKKSYKDQNWNIWADAWICGKNRNRDAARAAWAAASDAAMAASDAAWAAALAADRAADAGSIDLISIAEKAQAFKEE